MRVNKTPKKIFLILLGVIIGLIIVELGLNSAEFFYRVLFQTNKRESFDFDADACRIICLGDSWTLGMGAIPQQDYPSQLETILNKSKGSGKFKVYNLGYPNFTSSMAIKKFKDICPQLKPNIVIAMIGRSDQWISENEGVKSSFYQKVKQGVLNTKIIKLIKISLYNARYNVFEKQKLSLLPDEKTVKSAMAWVKSGNAHRTKKMFIEAQACYNKALGLIPDLMAAFLEKARCYKIEGKNEEALEVLAKAFVLDITNEEIAQELNDIFIRINDPAKRVDFYYRFFQYKPYSSFLKKKLVNAYILLGESLFINKQFNKSIENFDKALQLDPGNKKIYSSIIYNQAIIRQKGVSLSECLASQKNRQRQDFICLNIKETKFAENLQELIAICKKKNIKLIFSGYPLEILGPMQEVAAEYKIPLIDHRQYFQSAQSDFFAKDGHCNSKGYKVIAENISKYILSDQENKIK